ncbi:TPA: phage baseplate assembly protein [Escherichia coli]|uniref:phage baseplate assembly protein n=1 Tax=Escherichia coli TaxID=562 RepID=UPI003D9B6809
MVYTPALACQAANTCPGSFPSSGDGGGFPSRLASRLASHYNIGVSTDVDDLVKVPQFSLNWGESPQEILDRVSRWSALLYYDQPDGNLFLTRVGTKRAASGIAEGVNIEQAYYRRSMADRFSDYVGVSMSISPIAGFSPDTAYDSVTLATARDPEAASMRYRKRIIIVESTLMASQQAQRAIDWEMNRRYGRSRQLTVTIDSWRDKSGRLWEPNTLIPVNIPSLQLPDTELLIAEVTYIRDSDGTHARLYLMPPEAFAVQPYAFYQQIPGLNQ